MKRVLRTSNGHVVGSGNSKKERVLELLGEYNEIVDQYGTSLSLPRYKRYSMLRRFIIGCLVASGVLLIGQMFIDEFFAIGILELAVVAFAFGTLNDTDPPYLPISDKKAERFLENQLAEAKQGIGEFQTELIKLASIIEQFEKLRIIIVSDLGGEYERIDCLGDHRAVVSFEKRRLRKNKRVEYQMDPAGYEKLKWEVAKRWKLKHYADDRMMLLEEFDYQLEKFNW